MRMAGAMLLCGTLAACAWQYTAGYSPSPSNQAPGRDFGADLAECREQANQWAWEQDKERTARRAPTAMILSILTGAIPQALTGVGVYWGPARGNIAGEAVQEARACLIRKGWELIEEPPTQGPTEP